jgi:hypothetical protein
MKMRLTVAESEAEVLRCKQLIASVYNRQYGVVFSREGHDLDAKVEPWPHRYLMAVSGEALAATFGLYVRDTYVERFGGIHPEEIEETVALAAPGGEYAGAPRRELTKLVVAPPWRTLGLSPAMYAAAHSRAFLDADLQRPPIVLTCMKRSIHGRVVERLGIRARHLKTFPVYKVHEQYRSPRDPMDSYLTLPDHDVPPVFRDLVLPGHYDLVRITERGAP